MSGEIEHRRLLPCPKCGTKITLNNMVDLHGFICPSCGFLFTEAEITRKIKKAIKKRYEEKGVILY